MGRSLLADGTGLVFARANNLEITGTTFVSEIIENALILPTAPAATTQLSVLEGNIQYYTSNANTNWTLNIRGDATTSLDSTLSIGKAISVTIVTTQGSTPYFSNTVTIDGTSAGVTTRWIFATTPAVGYANGLDVYSYTIIKTANATWSVLASRSRFA